MRGFPDRHNLLLTLPTRAAEAQGITYTVTDLGTLGGPTSFATGINNRAQAVGFSAMSLTNNFHAFLGQTGAIFWDQITVPLLRFLLSSSAMTRSNVRLQ